jgi:hypothetical protein
VTEDEHPTADPAIRAEPWTPGEPAITAPPLEPPPLAPPPPPPLPAVQPVPIPLVTTRGLLGASFDLLTRSGQELRRASFYIGAIVLGTVGPFVLAQLAVEVVGFEMTFEAYEALLLNVSGPLGVLGFLAFAGVIVAAVESRTMAVAVLGGSMAERPVSIRRSVARSRQTFWRAIVASVVVAVPVALAQTGATQLIDALFHLNFEASEAVSLVTSTVVSGVVAAPFAYVLAGVVLGDVDPFEAVRRSFRVFRARKAAASIVVVFETITALLLVLGLSAGLDVVFRIFGALGLGVGSGTGGVAVTIAGVVVIGFAFGTLLFTVMAITIAPQVVMFVGLTHATVGLDRVRAGGPDDPDIRRPGVRRFRWLTMPMLLAFALGALGLWSAVSVATT